MAWVKVSKIKHKKTKKTKKSKKSKNSKSEKTEKSAKKALKSKKHRPNSNFIYIFFNNESTEVKCNESDRKTKVLIDRLERVRITIKVYSSKEAEQL